MTSMRYRSAPCFLLESILKAPISAVPRTCVPPHSSREKPSTSTTRTRSAYFSPKSIIAPRLRASSRVVVKYRTGWFSVIFCSELSFVRGDPTLVRHLPTAGGVERVLREHDIHLIVGVGDRLYRDYLGLDLIALVADEAAPNV